MTGGRARERAPKIVAFARCVLRPCEWCATPGCESGTCSEILLLREHEYLPLRVKGLRGEDGDYRGVFGHRIEPGIYCRLIVKGYLDSAGVISAAGLQALARVRAVPPRARYASPRAAAASRTSTRPSLSPWEPPPTFADDDRWSPSPRW